MVIRLWLANSVGVITLPISIHQFGFSKSKKYYLIFNFSSCILWYISLILTHQNTAAYISLTAGIASLLQAIIGHKVDRHRILNAWITALIAMNVAIYLAPPTNYWDMLPIIAFIWVRSAEVFEEFTMRLLITVSPLIWISIAWHGGNYGLIPADLLGFF